MKKSLLILLIALLALSTNGQNDTVYYSGGCDNSPKGQYFNFWLQNGVFYASGSIGGICCGTNFLVYRISNDTILMRKVHQGDACYCVCYFPFEFRVKNCNLPAYHAIIYQTNIDTIIYAQPTITGLSSNTDKPSVSVFPNPARDRVTIHLFGNWNGTSAFELFNIIGQKVYVKENITETFLIERGRLAKGAYFYKLRTQTGELFTGKILLE